MCFGAIYLEQDFGRSEDPHAHTVTMWVDLASPEHCDAGPASLTTIGSGDRPKAGALFLISGQLCNDPTPEPAIV